MRERLTAIQKPLAVALLLTVIAVGVAGAIIRQSSASATSTRLKANGTIEVDDLEIGAQRAARLAQHLVAEGASVKAGQVIAILDTSELTAQLAQAEGAAAAAAADLAELLKGTRTEELRRSSAQVAQVRAVVSGAERTLRNARLGYSRRTQLRQALDTAESQHKVAAESVRQAEAARAGAEAAHRTASEEYDTSVVLRQERDAAQAQLDAAQARYRTASAQLQQLLNGTRSEDIRAAEAQLGQAVAAVQTAREQASNATSDLKRARELHAGNALSDQALEAAVTRADTGRSRLDQAEQSRQQAVARLDQMRSGARKEEIEAAQGVAQQAQASIQGARRAFDNAREAYALRLAGRGQLDAARTQRQIAGAQLASARAALSGAALGARNARTAYFDALGEKQSVDTSVQQYEAAMAQLDAAQAQLDQARTGATREQIEQARGRLRQARGALDLARVQREQSIIRAPTNGVLTERVAEVGEIVNPGTTIARLMPLDEVYLTLYVPLTELGRVKLGQPVEITTDTYRGKVYSGTVSRISDTPEFTPRNVQTQDERVKLVFQVRVTAANSGRELKPGMPADAAIHLQ